MSTDWSMVHHNNLPEGGCKNERCTWIVLYWKRKWRETFRSIEDARAYMTANPEGPDPDEWHAIAGER